MRQIFQVFEPGGQLDPDIPHNPEFHLPADPGHCGQGAGHLPGHPLPLRSGRVHRLDGPHLRPQEPHVWQALQPRSLHHPSLGGIHNIYFFFIIYIEF